MLQPASPVSDVVCGDVFLTSFEWSSSSNSIRSSDSDASQRKNRSYDEGVVSLGKRDETGWKDMQTANRVPSILHVSMTHLEEAYKCVKRPVSFISSNNSSPSIACSKHVDSEKERVVKKPYVLPSNRLDDIIQCYSGHQDQRVLITSASFPYHVEWVSSAWSKMCGWSSDEVLGLDCKFLQGDATDKREVSRFMCQLLASGGHASLNILNYSKDDTLHRVTLNCIPLVDDCGPNNVSKITHIGAVLVDSSEVHHSSECAELLEGRALEEVGMPLDRREGCRSCSNLNRLPPINAEDWLSRTEGLPLAHMLRYMVRSQAPIVLTDSVGRVVHVNMAWVTLSGFTAVDVEGQLLSSVFNVDPNSRQGGTVGAKSFFESSPIFSGAVYLKRKTARRPFGRALSTASSLCSMTTEESSFVTSSKNSTNTTTNSTGASSPTSSYKGGMTSRGFFAAPSLPLHLSPVSIGCKHFAVMCFAGRPV